MGDESRFQLRVAQLIGAYADRAPVDIDPAAMARFIVAEDRTRSIRPRFLPSHVGLGFGILVIAVLSAIIGGAIVGGSPSKGDRDQDLPDRFRVGSFIGLPPAGAAPSRPETGKLLLEASGRCTSDGSFCFVWIYQDGRLIWLRDGALWFGANQRTTGLLEQRLAPIGVERLVSAFTATGRCTEGDRDEPIVCALSLPGPAPFPPIEDPGWIDRSWGLAATDWEDPGIWGFVPSTFGACFLENDVVSASSYTTWQPVEPARVLALLPQDAAELLRGRDIDFPPRLQGLPGLAVTCFGIPTDDARALSDILGREGFELDAGSAPYRLGYRLGAPPPLRDAVIWLVPILPHGKWVVSGFG